MLDSLIVLSYGLLFLMSLEVRFFFAKSGPWLLGFLWLIITFLIGQEAYFNFMILRNPVFF